jgi:hypothetical protein
VTNLLRNGNKNFRLTRIKLEIEIKDSDDNSQKKEHHHEGIEIRNQRPHLRHDRGRSNRSARRTRWQDDLLFAANTADKSFCPRPPVQSRRLGLVAAAADTQKLQVK